MADVIDSTLMQGNFSTPEVRAVWSDKNKLSQQLKVERTLSEVQGQQGIIPKQAADDIVKVAKIDNFDIKQLSQQAAQQRHTLMPLVNHLAQLAGPKSGEYVHYGVTTQDIVDTGIMLQLVSAYRIIVDDGVKLIQALTPLVKKYASTPMIGRTHGIQAVPITFGFKAATWLSELLRDQQRLEKLADAGAFVGSISGAVGTYSAWGQNGPKIEKAVLEKLHLGVPDISWQSSRDRFSEIVSDLAIYSGTLGKIGQELFNLMRTEIDEVEEPFKKGEIGSTTMPQKRNPALIEGLASLTQPVFKDAGLILESMLFNNERDAIHWRNEWVVLPEVTNYLDAQIRNATFILANLTVKPNQMQKNLQLQGDLVYSERIMFELSKQIGKQTAHKVVYESAMQAYEQNKNFIQLLANHQLLKGKVSEAQLQKWANLTDVVQEATAKARLVADKANDYLKKRKEVFQ